MGGWGGGEGGRISLEEGGELASWKEECQPLLHFFVFLYVVSSRRRVLHFGCSSKRAPTSQKCPIVAARGGEQMSLLRTHRNNNSTCDLLYMRRQPLAQVFVLLLWGEVFCCYQGLYTPCSDLRATTRTGAALLCIFNY